MKRVLLSAAHTLDAPGQIEGDLKEAELTRKILKFCIPYLEKKQIEFKTVPLDMNLLDRIDWVNKTGYSESQGDVFIEIHINDGGKTGVEAWYSGNPGPKNKSQTLAEFLLNDFCNRTKFVNQKARSEYEHSFGQLIILNQTKPISTALEILYIDNPQDAEILRDDAKLDGIAKDLVESIYAYIQLTDEELEKLRSKQEAREIKPAIPLTDFEDDLLFNSFTPTQLGNSTTNQNSNQGSNTSGLSSSSNSSSPNNSSTKIMDRNERKQMIKDVYKKFFGKDPEETLVNTYTNQGVNEEELMKKILDSDEYKKMLEEYQNFKQNEDKFKQNENEIKNLNQKLRDTERMLENLTKLLKHKRALISRLRFEITARGITLPGEFLDYNTPPQNLPTDQQNPHFTKNS